jgi:hypothetical protein
VRKEDARLKWADTLDALSLNVFSPDTERAFFDVTRLARAALLRIEDAVSTDFKKLVELT